MFKKKIKEIEIRCTVCGKHVSTEEVKKAHYIARDPISRKMFEKMNKIFQESKKEEVEK